MSETAAAEGVAFAANVLDRASAASGLVAVERTSARSMSSSCRRPITPCRTQILKASFRAVSGLQGPYRDAGKAGSTSFPPVVDPAWEFPQLFGFSQPEPRWAVTDSSHGPLIDSHFGAVSIRHHRAESAASGSTAFAWSRFCALLDLAFPPVFTRFHPPGFGVMRGSAAASTSDA